MTDRPVFVVSDIHIGAVPAETERSFRLFLDYAAAESSALVINGDLFDVWVPSHRFVMRPYARVLAKLTEIVEEGLRVYFVGGNHDALEYVGSVLTEDTGVIVLDDPASIELGPFRALVAHGDGVSRWRDGYRKENAPLRAALRFGPLRSLAERILPIDWLYDRASPWSRVPGIVARHQRGEGTGDKTDAEPIRTWAAAQLAHNPDIDIVLAGHSHLPEWVEVEPGRFYVNAGDWIEHMTYATLPVTRGEPEIRRWPDRALVAPVGRVPGKGPPEPAADAR